MNAQEILTSVIEGIFWVSVAFIIFQFITGLFVMEHIYTVVQLEITTVTPTENTRVNDKPQNITAQNTQFEQLPDPWFLEPLNQNINQPAIILPFPTLKLLPPAKELQPKRNNRKKPTTSNKSASAKSPRKPGRNNKVA